MFITIINTTFGIIVALIVFSIIVFVHEFGHFIFAKIFGIGVEVFSIGFGGELFGFTLGKTRYRLSWIPFGGYCKLKGENGEFAEDGTYTTIFKQMSKSKKDKSEVFKNFNYVPDAMYNRPPYARLFTVSGGVLFNLLFGFVVMYLLFIVGFKEKIVAPYIEVFETIDGKPTPAYTAGLRSKDYIISINGKKVDGYFDITKYTMLGKKEKFKVLYLRDGVTNETTVIPEYNNERGVSEIGIGMMFYSIVGDVISNSPAYYAGLKENDRIISIDGEKINYFFELKEKIKDKANQVVTIVVERGGNLFTNQIKLDRFEGKGFLGVSPKDAITYERMQKAKDPIDAVYKSLKEIGVIFVDTYNGLVAMIKGRIDVRRNIAGPLRIIGITSQIAVHSDPVGLLRFMVLLSVMLGFFNLLPIPALDGSHVILNLIETITPFRIPLKVRSYIEYIGFLFIIFLSIIVFLNDIVNILSGR